MSLVERIEGAVMELAIAAAALNVATDGQEAIRSERQRVLEALENLAALRAREASNG